MQPSILYLCVHQLPSFSSLPPPSLFPYLTSYRTATPLAPLKGNPQTGERFEAGPEHAHDRIDSKDERSLANNLADAEHVEKIQKKEEKEHAHEDPTKIARSHGNEPSSGAKKDKELLDDDEEELKKKDMAKQQSKAAHGK